MIDISKLDFSKGNGLIPAIIQDKKTNEVLMLGFMNSEALETTIRKKKITFFSRSKNRLWTKGETSGNYLELNEIYQDCDHDTLLIRATPVGPVCHNGTDTCFGNYDWTLETLESIIQRRKTQPSDQSYTASLFKAGINKIAQKVGEEAVELVIEAKDHDDKKFIGEAADLLFHYLILLNARNLSLENVISELKARHQKSQSE